MHDINRFLNTEAKITIWPKKHADKVQVLEYIIEKFDLNGEYTEGEINEVLNNWHMFSDWALLRRALVDSNYLKRKPDGSSYKRIK